MAADDGRVVSNFIVQALKGEDITVYGTGQQTRSFCYVDDLITGMIKLMESDDSVTGPVNMGNPGEFTMLELAEKVIKYTQTDSKIVYKDLPQDDPQQRRPDISRAKQLLGWEPTFDLDEGLKRTIRYFEDCITN
jgi:UDP-glucuronate decarboxylase